MTTLLLNQGSNLAQTDLLLACSFYLDQTMEEDRTNLVELRTPPECRLEESLGQIKHPILRCGIERMMKMIRKNLDDAVHGVSQVSKEGRQLSPQVALSKI